MTSPKILSCCLLFCCLLFLGDGVSAQEETIRAGKQRIVFNGPEGYKGKPFPVWVYSPTDRPDTLPMVIMLHGAERNPSAYLDQWAPAANLYGYVVVAPEFSKEDYKGAERYNLGNVYDEKKKEFKNPNEWTFSVIEPLFDEMRKRTGSVFTGYYLSGHSAGSQFVHRFLYFVPNNRAIKVMIANAGWYTLPDRSNEYPFGLKDAPVTNESLITIFNKKVYVILGEADTDTTSANFNNGPPYNKQGANRYERGLNYFAVANRLANDFKTSFNWQLITLPGVAHSNTESAKAAAALFKMNFKKQ